MLGFGLGWIAGYSENIQEVGKGMKETERAWNDVQVLTTRQRTAWIRPTCWGFQGRGLGVIFTISSPCSRHCASNFTTRAWAGFWMKLLFLKPH